MKTVTVTMALAASMAIGLAYAENAAPVASTSTSVRALPAPTMISPGRYTANVMPYFNKDMAGRLETALRKINGLEKVEAHSGDSTLHFTVKDGVKVRVADIAKTVAATDSGAVMSSPLLEHSLSSNPGV